MTDADLYPIAMSLSLPSPRWVVSVDIRVAIVAGVRCSRRDAEGLVEFRECRTVVRFRGCGWGCAFGLGGFGL